MNWAKKPYHDGDGFYWTCALPIGEVWVDFADWVDAERPWMVNWCPVGDADVAIGRAKSARAGKALAHRYVQRLVDGLIAEGF